MGNTAMRRLGLAGFALLSFGVQADVPVQAPIPTIAVQATRFPVVFEENRGQAPAGVRFLARSSGLTAYLDPSGVSFRFRPNNESTDTNSLLKRKRLRALAPSRPAVAPVEFTLRLHGASTATLEGLDPLPGHSNYLRGNDRSKWITDVPHFARVRYRDVYPGIDQIFHGAQRKIEYDLVVAPGADPSPILLEISGAETLEKDTLGNVLAHTPAGLLKHQIPIAYQGAGSTRGSVNVEYELLGDTKIALRIGAYDHTKPLVIDPIVDYSTYLGGARADSGQGIGVDSDGNVYLTGMTLSTDFPVKLPFQPSLRDNDSYVTKINAAGDAIVYSTFFGGSDVDNAYALAVLPDGRAVIAGETQSTDLPTLHPIQSTLKGISNVFVTELNAQGNGLVFSTYLGGRLRDRANAVAVDAAGNVYVAGDANSPDFPSTNVITPCSIGYTGFVSKLSADGTRLLYSVCISGTTLGNGAHPGDSTFTAIAVDRLQQVYVAGSTISIDFPSVNAAQAYRLPIEGGDAQDVAVAAKLNAAGTALVYSTYIGGASLSYGRGIAVDSAGSAYVSGTVFAVIQCPPLCSPLDFPLVNPAEPLPGVGQFAGYIVKLSPAGDKFLYATYIGTCEGGAASGGVVAVDDFGNAYIGRFTNCPSQVTEYKANLTKVTAGGLAVTNFILAGTTAGAGSMINGIALDAAANVYVTGETYPGGIPTVNPIQPNPGSQLSLTDAFVAKISYASPPSSVSLLSSINPAELQQPITFTVSVPGPGHVQLLDGTKVLADGSPLLGTFETTFTLATLSAGDHPLTAIFTPTGSAPVPSPVLVQHVTVTDCVP